MRLPTRNIVYASRLSTQSLRHPYSLALVQSGILRDAYEWRYSLQRMFNAAHPNCNAESFDGSVMFGE